MNKFQKINDEKFSKDFIKINGFSFKRGNSSKRERERERDRDRERKITHFKNSQTIGRRAPII